MNGLWRDDSGEVVIASPPTHETSHSGGDLRHFIQRLADQGRLVRIKEAVDWKFEIGRITRESRSALLFENIAGYPGQRVFTNGLSDFISFALALGVGGGITAKALLQEARKRLLAPVIPRLVETGPVMENIVPQSAVNLLDFPVPWWNEQDAGRYIGTWHINVSKDPDTGSRNVGVYRMQLLDSRHATVSASAQSHLAQHIANAEKKGEPLPMALVLGINEALIMAGAAACPFGTDEYGLAGALRQRPIELIRCQNVDLEVPAGSEIVVEGVIQPGVRTQDGPYVDYTGKPTTNPAAFLFEATHLMFRNDPIFRGASIGLPGSEDHQLFALLAQLELADFHGSRMKQVVQNHLLKRRLFRPFQLAGKLGTAVRKLE